MRAELAAVERGKTVAESDAGVLVAYERGERRWALVTTARQVLSGSEDEPRRHL